jgi:ATP-dependent RNA helicase DDX27
LSTRLQEQCPGVERRCSSASRSRLANRTARTSGRELFSVAKSTTTFVLHATSSIMAPNIDDDFIFTISDHDDVSDDGGAEEAAIAKLAGRGKKRKHTEDPTDLNVREKVEVPSKKAKKDKKGNKGKQAEPQEDDDAQIAEPGEDVENNDDIVSDFEFAVGDIDTRFVEEFDGWGNEQSTANQEHNAERKSNAVDVDDIIERRRNKKLSLKENAEEPSEAAEEFDGFGEDDELLADDAFGMGAGSESDSDADVEDEEEDNDVSKLGNASAEDDDAQSDGDDAAPSVPHPMDLEPAETDDEAESGKEDAVEAKKAAAFFAPEEILPAKKKGAKGGSFQSMSLSRPIQKGLAAIGFTEPTPIQSKTIPIAMQGKDVVGGAETGSGKTAAFLIPILERLLYRPKKIPTTRVAIFMPTRELAVQCFNVATKLASFTDISFALLAGGFSSREQEAMLKTRPDVVIATPGRFIDHMHNTAAFQVEHLEILVLDEADRMLEEGFESQLNEILTTIPKSRQTMLFSATMTSTVDNLIRIGMDKPVRLMVDAKKQTVAGLTQEFIRLRQGKEDKRLAYLMYVCEKIYTERVIVFFRQKKEAHRVRVVFALCGMKASELHGNMSQEQVIPRRI